MQEWNIPTDRVQRVDEKYGTFVYLSLNVKNGLFFVFSADDSKKSVTVWEKYLGVTERSYLALSESAVHYWVLSYN